MNTPVGGFAPTEADLDAKFDNLENRFNEIASEIEDLSPNIGTLDVTGALDEPSRRQFVMNELSDVIKTARANGDTETADAGLDAQIAITSLVRADALDNSSYNSDRQWRDVTLDDAENAISSLEENL